ncbi:hypothetical protein [Actinomadura opuntiae]|uniref:hypothetical protein n=1 Tax=Actinomadura sp. OS1-43 TaxID=604315 RepID=UPI00255A719B|nr:hypothetical protein [Actinomadura sp. OS1-43]MDL4812825.1 hypothetical protein [Actinomadura sp. OS1-43]
MTRYWFGGQPSDYTYNVDPSGAVVFAPSAQLAAFNAQTGGAAYDSLLDEGGNQTATLVAGDGTILPAGKTPRFQGPDEVLSLWIGPADGSGTRYLMLTTDLADLLRGKLDLAGGTMEGELRLQDDSPAASEDYVDSHGGAGGAPSILPFSVTGILSVRAGTARVYNDTGRPLTLGTVRASAAVAPAGQALIVDVLLNGTSIYTTPANRPTIAAGAVTGTGGTPGVTTWAPGDYLTVDIVQVGTTTPGSDLTVTVPST